MAPAARAAVAMAAEIFIVELVNWFFTIEDDKMILVGADVVFIFIRCPQPINNIHPDLQGPASDWAGLRHTVVSA